MKKDNLDRADIEDLLSYQRNSEFNIQKSAHQYYLENYEQDKMIILKVLIHNEKNDIQSIKKYLQQNSYFLQEFGSQFSIGVEMLRWRRKYRRKTLSLFFDTFKKQKNQDMDGQNGIFFLLKTRFRQVWVNQHHEYDNQDTIQGNKQKYSVFEQRRDIILQTINLALGFLKQKTESAKCLKLICRLVQNAGKKIKIRQEFIRELCIMQKIQNQNTPSLFDQDIEQQVLFMELGLCSLFDLKQYFEKNDIKVTDNLAYSILINIFQAIESLLQNFDKKENKVLPLFHSDIKPQNIILTVQNSQEKIPQIKLMLIDFGGASFQPKDYWSYYTPAFVCPQLWEKLVNRQFNFESLTRPEIRYVELYAACRSEQFLICKQTVHNLFKKEKCQDFINTYSKSYPQTCQIFQNIFFEEYQLLSK